MTKNIIISIAVVAIALLIGYKVWGPGSSASTARGTGLDDTGLEMSSSTAAANQPLGEFGDASTSASATAPSQGTLITNTTTNTIKNNMHTVTITTNYGTIAFETYDADAPNTVKNFITLAEKGFYNGVIFHRVIPGFMIQGGDPTGTGTGGPGYKFADELNPSTASYQAGYKKGVVAMANAGPNTNGSQFFIMTVDYPLPNNYTIFGHVISGQDIVDAIANVQRDGSDKPLTPVTMKTVTVN